MCTYLCHQCARARGELPPFAGEPFVGNQYQFDKYVKHTVPTTGPLPVSVFDLEELSAYSGYAVQAQSEGCVEFDCSGRKNIVWAAGRLTGFLIKNGELVQPLDAVKVVLTSSTGRVHAFPAPSTAFSIGVCSVCGQPIIH